MPTLTPRKSITLSKKRLIALIAKDGKVTHAKARYVLRQFFDRIVKNLVVGGRLEFRNFGVFEVVYRKQRIGRNPKNPTIPVVIPPYRTIKFTPGKRLLKLMQNEENN